MQKVLPGFRASCLVLAVLYVGTTLASPHYADAMFWVFLHMTMIGAIIGVVGWFADSVRTQRAFARLMLVAICVYSYLDVRTADWPLVRPR